MKRRDVRDMNEKELKEINPKSKGHPLSKQKRNLALRQARYDKMAGTLSRVDSQGSRFDSGGYKRPGSGKTNR